MVCVLWPGNLGFKAPLRLSTIITSLTTNIFNFMVSGMIHCSPRTDSHTDSLTRQELQRLTGSMFAACHSSCKQELQIDRCCRWSASTTLRVLLVPLPPTPPPRFSFNLRYFHSICYHSVCGSQARVLAARWAAIGRRRFPVITSSLVRLQEPYLLAAWCQTGRDAD